MLEICENEIFSFENLIAPSSSNLKMLTRPTSSRSRTDQIGGPRLRQLQQGDEGR